MASQAATAESGGGASGGVSRREFLYYVWGASIALIALQGAGLLLWFLIPRFREGEFGGTFTIGVGDVPEINTPPINFAEGRFWLVNLDTTQPNDLMYQAPMNRTQSRVSPPSTRSVPIWVAFTPGRRLTVVSNVLAMVRNTGWMVVESNRPPRAPWIDSRFRPLPMTRRPFWPKPTWITISTAR